MSRCAECKKMMCLQSNCQTCKELNEFQALLNGDCVELPKIDLGQAIRVSPEEKHALTDNALIHHGNGDKFTNHYGHCPGCGAPGVNRERRINGNDICSNGHKYPSSNSILGIVGSGG